MSRPFHHEESITIRTASRFPAFPIPRPRLPLAPAFCILVPKIRTELHSQPPASVAEPRGWLLHTVFLGPQNRCFYMSLRSSSYQTDSRDPYSSRRQDAAHRTSALGITCLCYLLCRRCYLLSSFLAHLPSVRTLLRRYNSRPSPSRCKQYLYIPDHRAA